MIAKVTSGGSFGSTLNYLMNEKKEGEEERKDTKKERGEDAQKEQQIGEGHFGEKASVERLENNPEMLFDESQGKRHRVIGGNMTGRTQRELAQEFGVFREQRPDIKKPVHHASLSAARGENWGIKLWNEIAEKYVTKMGFENSPYIVIQHIDTAHNHVHILTSRIDVNGKVVSDFQSKQRAEEVMREVEREYGLQQVKPSRDVIRRAPTRGEVEWFNRTGEMSVKMSLQAQVEQALADQPTATQFVERLQNAGVDVIPNIQSSGMISGISFRQDEEMMKGCDLGRGFSWGGLQERGLRYEPERDMSSLEEARERAVNGYGAETVTTEPIFITPQPEVGIPGSQLFTNLINPIEQIENQPWTYERLEESLSKSEGANYFLTEENAIERLYRAAGLEPVGEDALERLNHSVGIEPNGADSLTQLYNSVGVERAEPSIESNNEAAPELVDALEQEVDEEMEEYGIDFVFGLF